MAKKKDWRQLVKEAEPNYKDRQVEYEFSSGRKFKEKKEPYK